MITHPNQPSAPSFGRFISIKQAASFLDCSTRTIRREIARGKFPQPAKIGRLLRFTLQDVELYAASIRQQS